MGIKKPYRRTVRIFTDNTYGQGGKWEYIQHHQYADSPAHFVRAFLLIQEDLIKIFNYIEPSDINSKTYSHRIHELLVRTCIEVEANFTAILKENKYPGNAKDWTMKDYRKIEQSHYLSHYEVSLPTWKGTSNIRMPFKQFSGTGSVPWYKAYNNTKHDRHQNFEQANFESLVDAVSGLAVLMAAQFYTWSFSTGSTLLSIGNGRQKDDFESSIGDLFRIKYPKNISDSEKYDFSYEEINFNRDIFENFKYT